MSTWKILALAIAIATVGACTAGSMKEQRIALQTAKSKAVEQCVFLHAQKHEVITTGVLAGIQADCQRSVAYN